SGFTRWRQRSSPCFHSGSAGSPACYSILPAISYWNSPQPISRLWSPVATDARSCLNCATPLPAEAHFCLNCGAPTPTEPGVPPRTMPTGAVEVNRVRAALANVYRIERVLGEGGMATVYLAQ